MLTNMGVGNFCLLLPSIVGFVFYYLLGGVSSSTYPTKTKIWSKFAGGGR